MHTALNIWRGSIFSSILHVRGCLEKRNRHGWQIQSLRQCLKWCLFSTHPALSLNTSGTLNCMLLQLKQSKHRLFLQRDGLMQLGEVHTERERALSVKPLADTLMPSSNMQVIKTQQNMYSNYFLNVTTQLTHNSPQTCVTSVLSVLTLALH